MNDDIFYEPVGEEDFQRIIVSLETEVGRLKGELVLSSTPITPIERHQQQIVGLRSTEFAGIWLSSGRRRSR
jgi:hypothetical protein